MKENNKDAALSLFTELLDTKVIHEVRRHQFAIGIRATKRIANGSFAASANNVE